MAEENKKIENAQSEQSLQGTQSAMLNPPTPPTKKEMSSRELRIAGYTTKKNTSRVIVVLLMTIVVVLISGFVGYCFRGGVKGITPRTIVAQAKSKSNAKGKLVSSGVVAHGNLVAAITGTPAVKDGAVSFTVQWKNNSSNSTYTPSDFSVSQGGSNLQAKSGYYGEEILPGQKKEVAYAYNLLNKKDDVKIVLGQTDTAGKVATKLVGTTIKIRGE
jgi:hypothetical protein